MDPKNTQTWKQRTQLQQFINEAPYMHKEYFYKMPMQGVESFSAELKPAPEDIFAVRGEKVSIALNMGMTVRMPDNSTRLGEVRENIGYGLSNHLFQGVQLDLFELERLVAEGRREAALDLITAMVYATQGRV